MPLSMMKLGERGRVLRISGGDAIRARLAELGFVVGQTLRVITMLEGNLIIDLKGSRVALGQDMANRITITPLAAEEPAKEPAAGPRRRRFGWGQRQQDPQEKQEERI